VGKMQNRLKIYTVSQVNSLIKAILDNNLPGQITVSGEISGWKGAHSSGICYFSLKDEGAVLPCVMWSDKFAKVKFRPENGLAIFGTGYISVYELQGKYQFYIESMEPAGKGALWLAYEQTKNRLAEEGLFDKAHKKPLPKYPKRIGILTSESGAAVRDIEKSIFDRWSCVLCLYHVPVQGEGAAKKIAAGLRDINKRNRKLKLDVLIVGRGGGSLEDLWAFNEEVLARAIFDSKIPIISAVGHEIDTTVADYVADARASTPTKAGVVAVPNMQEVLSILSNYQSSLNNNIVLCYRYRQQQLDEIADNMMAAIKQFLAERRELLYQSYEQIIKIEPHRLLGKMRDDLSNLQNSVNSAMRTTINKCRMRLTAQANLLAGLNPKSVLKRGYSITTNKKTGRVIRKLEEIKVGDLMITELAEEKLVESKVTKK